VYTKDPFDSSSISDNVISALFVDGSGCLWVGTTDGVLNRLDRKSEGFTHYRVCTKKNLPPIPGNFYKYPIIFSRNNDCTITSIVEEGSRYLWVGTWGHGLYKFDKITGKTTGNFFHDKNDSLLWDLKGSGSFIKTMQVEYGSLHSGEDWTS
jgi:ligand-binding sensor domain-containing protein